MTKLCSKCGVEKDVGEFYKSKVTKDGYMYHCKECHKNSQTIMMSIENV